MYKQVIYLFVSYNK